MAKTTTTKDLLLYAYNETDLLNSDRIQRGIDGDPLVTGEYKEVLEALENLNCQLPVPGDACIQRILEFARH